MIPKAMHHYSVFQKEELLLKIRQLESDCNISFPQDGSEHIALLTTQKHNTLVTE